MRTEYTMETIREILQYYANGEATIVVPGQPIVEASIGGPCSIRTHRCPDDNE